MLTATISAATISAGSAGYIGVFVNLPPALIITLVVLSMGLVACLSTRQSVTLADFMTLVEIGGLVLISAAGFAAGSGVVTRLPEILPASGDIAVWVGLSGTTLIAVFAFIGFEHLVNVNEEMKTPSRTLPWALFLTLGLTALVYALVVWVAVFAVPPHELATSSAPLALVFERLTGMPLKSMSVIAVVGDPEWHHRPCDHDLAGAVRLGDPGQSAQGPDPSERQNRRAPPGHRHRRRGHPDTGACGPAGRAG